MGRAGHNRQLHKLGPLDGAQQPVAGLADLDAIRRHRETGCQASSQNDQSERGRSAVLVAPGQRCGPLQGLGVTAERAWGQAVSVPNNRASRGRAPVSCAVTRRIRRDTLHANRQTGRPEDQKASL